jgi:hypothetical protein
VIRFHCPHCGAFLRAPDERAGRRAVCSGCRQKVPVPLAQPDAGGGQADEELVEVLPDDEGELEEGVPPARVRVRPRKRPVSPWLVVAAAGIPASILVVLAGLAFVLAFVLNSPSFRIRLRVSSI